MAWSPQSRAAALAARKRKGHRTSSVHLNAPYVPKKHQPYKVGDYYSPTVTKSGHVKVMGYTAYDTKANKRKRTKAKLVGAAIGTAVLPGAGTAVGLIGANRHIAKHGYGYTLKPHKATTRTTKRAKYVTKSPTHGAAVSRIPKSKAKKRY